MFGVEFEVDCVGCGQSVKMVTVWIAVELDKDCSDAKGGFILPEMVYECDGGYALSPEP